MILSLFALAIVTLPAFTVSEEPCPAVYKRFSANHSFCKPPNPTCSFVTKGLQNKDKEITDILRVHNEYRSRVAMGEETLAGHLPSASNMLALSWDDELAGIAQKWAEQCKFEHDCGECRAAASFSVGQNIAYNEYSCGGECENKAPDWSNTIKMFYDEVKDFDKSLVESVKFPKGKMIGHFTQVVWAKTWKVGCGYVSYKNRNNIRQFYVCNYGPGGNMRNDPLYKKGNPCSDCPQNSCCGESCKGKSENIHPGLCQLLSSPPVYPKNQKSVYYCAFENGDKNCEYQSEGAGSWKLTETAGGTFLSVVANGKQSITANFRQSIKTKSESCMYISLRKGANIAGEKDDSTLEVEFENNGQKDQMSVWSYPSSGFINSPVQIFNAGEFKFSIKFSVPAGAPPQYVEIRSIEVTDEACKY